MGSGFGVDATLSGGVPIGGTSSLDIRKIFGGLYTAGIVSGAGVATTAGLNYSVSAGLAMISAGTGEIIPAPIPSGTVATAPVTTARTDIIYAKQNYPSIEGNSDVVLGVVSGTSPVLPARAVALKSYTLAAGITKTSDAVVTGGINYAIPYGASLGLLHADRVVGNGTFSANSTWGVKSFYLPTDRRVRINLQTNLSANGANGFDNTKYCEVYFDIVLDGLRKWRWNTPGLHQSHATFGWTDMITLNAGWHTIGYDRIKTGAGTPFHHYEANGLGGTLFWVEDMGPSV